MNKAKHRTTWIFISTAVLFFLLPEISVAQTTPEPSPSTPADPVQSTVSPTPTVSSGISYDRDIKLFVTWSLAYLGQGYPVIPDAEHTDVNGIRSSSLIHIPGLGTNIRLSDTVYLSPEIDFTFDEYIYKNSLAMAFPTLSMTGTGAGGPVATVMGLLVSIPFDFRIPLNQQITLELSPGISLYPLIPIEAIDGSTGIEVIGEYLNKDLKWLYPSTAMQLSFRINNNLEAAGRIRALYPIWHAWSGDLPFYDHLIVDLGLVLRFIP